MKDSRLVFTDYVWAFEITSALLGIAVVAAVLLSRRSTETPLDADDYPDVIDIFEDDVPENRLEELGDVDGSRSGAAGSDNLVSDAEDPR